MVFKGTAKRTAAEVNRDLDALGSKSNAYTSEEQTVYYAAVLPEYQDAVVEILADMMRHILGEDLNIGCVLSWGPCWYHQKEFFEGKVNDLSKKNYLM